jgi:hypothetical protein
MQRRFRLFSSSTTYAVLFKEMVSINYDKYYSRLRENRNFALGPIWRASTSYNLHTSRAPAYYAWNVNAIRQSVQAPARHIHTYCYVKGGTRDENDGF